MSLEPLVFRRKIEEFGKKCLGVVLDGLNAHSMDRNDRFYLDLTSIDTRSMSKRPLADNWPINLTIGCS